MDIKLLKKAYNKHLVMKTKYEKMFNYYKGDTDAMRKYKMITERSNNKTPTNFIQNFVDEEVSYSVGNDIAYVSKSGDSEIIKDINYYLSTLSSAHDTNLLEKMLIASRAYELYYIDKNTDFAIKVISAQDGTVVIDDDGDVKYFLHLFTKTLEEGNFIDVYTDDYIYHYNNKFAEVAPRTRHRFETVPVGVATYNIEEDSTHKTIYGLIKNLQDSYETNLSDISNEISDFRNAYLSFSGVQVDSDDLAEMKKLGIIATTSGDVSWLIKNINDSFIQNTLSTIENKMYQLTKHINHNEKYDMTTSGVALRTRMMGLEQKCKLNQSALEDCIKMRIKMLFRYLEVVKNKRYDYRDIKIVFSPNLPSDDLATAQMIKTLGDRLSLQTALSKLSFIENTEDEINKINKEQEELYEGFYLLNE